MKTKGNWLTNLFSLETKSRTRSEFMGMPAYDAQRNERAFILEGYIFNVICFRCINEIARCASTIKVSAKKTLKGGSMDEVPNHPLQLLIDKPNISQKKNTFIFNLVVNYLITGSAYIERLKDSRSKITELNILPSQEVTVDTNTPNLHLPLRYVWQAEKGGQRIYPVDQITGDCDLLHFKEYNPADRYRGLSAMEAAAYSVDLHNSGMRWNNALLKNSGRPSGILTTASNLSDNAYNRMREWIDKFWKGEHNAGSIPLLEGGLQWQQSSLSPTDMDYKNSIEAAARNIAAVFGVPFALVVPEAATYSNMETAREMLYENTVIPLLERILDELSGFCNLQKDGVVLQMNQDTIPALEGKRAKKFDRMVKVVDRGILTRDEARKELGYPEIGGMAAELFIPSNQTPLDDSFNPTDEFNRLNNEQNKPPDQNAA